MILQFEAQTKSIASGRNWVVAQALTSGVPTTLVPLVKLLGSELITNAVEHGPERGVVTVRAFRVDARFRVEVDDEGTDPPLLREPESDATGGRGIQLIDTLASRWGCEVHGTTGKTIWFDLSVD